MPNQTIFPFVEYPSSTTESTAKIRVSGKFLPPPYQVCLQDCDDVYFFGKFASCDVIQCRKGYKPNVFIPLLKTCLLLSLLLKDVWCSFIRNKSVDLKLFIV